MLQQLRHAARFLLIACALAVAGCSGSEEPAEPRTSFNIGWSIYAGWMPWPYAQQTGIVKKWADKYGLEINFVQVNDYVESVNQYTAGKLDGVTVAILGDYSNGNDAVLLKGGGDVAAIKGREVYLVELSVSHYLLARALETNGMKLTDVKTVNTSDADIASAFASPQITAAVAWNPQVTTMKGVPGTTAVFSSADIPGESLDLLVVDTATLKANPDLGSRARGDG
jgi:NitT/TauT family transport system substrate-binding protein